MFEPGQMDSICPICFDEFEDQQVASTDVCDHLFCFTCLEKWAKHESFCPVDRKRFKKIIKSKSDDVIQVKPRKRKKNRERYDVTAYCEVCRQSTSSATLLLCDCCDLAYHCACLTPPLTEIPAGLWFCPPCVEIDERLKRRCGTSKECEYEEEIPNLIEDEPPNLNEDKVTQSERRSMPKLSPWKKKNFEESINPLCTSDEDFQNISKKINNAVEKNQNGTLRVVVEKLDFANLAPYKDSALNVSSFKSPLKAVRTESSLEQKSSTSFAKDIHASESEQKSSTVFSTEENVITENSEENVITENTEGHVITDNFPAQRHESIIVAAVPVKKDFQFSIFQKLEDVSSSELKYSELATASSNPKTRIPCDICKCWKIKNRTERLEKLLQRKKLCLTEQSVKIRASRKSPSKKGSSESRASHKRNALIHEIQQIQQKKWKLHASYKLKKRRIMRELRQQVKRTTSNTNQIQAVNSLPAGPSYSKKIQAVNSLPAGPSYSKNTLYINEEPSLPCMSTDKDVKCLEPNSKLLKSNAENEISGMVEFSSDALEAGKSSLSAPHLKEKMCKKSAFGITEIPELGDQNHCSNGFLNANDKTVKTEDANMLSKSLNLSDLKHIIIRSDGSLYLDYPGDVS